MAEMANALATAEQLYRRNTLGSLPSDLRDTVFFQIQCLTQAAGLLLQLPQSVTARANVVLARYWLADPPMAREFSDISAASVYLVAKLGPSPRTSRDVANVYAYLLSPASCLFRSKGLPPPASDPGACYVDESAYFSFHQRVLEAEARVLYALSFDTHVALPHPLAVTYLQALDFLSHPKEAVSRRALEYLNTALLSPQLLYVTHQPNALAVAAIYNAAKDVGAKMPECAWWEVFDCDRVALGFLVVAMRSLEPWARARRDESPLLWEGMVTRARIELEVAKRGVAVGNGAAGGEDHTDDDEEARLTIELDRRMETSES